MEVSLDSVGVDGIKLKLLYEQTILLKVIAKATSAHTFEKLYEESKAEIYVLIDQDLRALKQINNPDPDKV